jgi:Flp pilus assembly pilin Flp
MSPRGFSERIQRLTRGEEGQSMVEYSIVAALIAVVSMAAVQALGGGIAHVFQNILGKIQGMP